MSRALYVDSGNTNGFTPQLTYNCTGRERVRCFRALTGLRQKPRLRTGWPYEFRTLTSAQFTFTFSRGGCAEYGAGPKAGEAIISPSECAKECQDSVKLGKAWYVKEGYDMVTGVGTPAYNKLKELVLKLP